MTRGEPEASDARHEPELYDLAPPPPPGASDLPVDRAILFPIPQSPTETAPLPVVDATAPALPVGSSHKAAQMTADLETQQIQRLLASSAAVSGDKPRWKNWRLQGAGASPFIVYGSLMLVIVVWLLGAIALSFFGPLGTLLLMAALFATVWRLSWLQQRRERRETAGECPACGYDLRASPATCPECGRPIPESILRRRRNATQKRIIDAG